jgi:hypothetical protein
MEQSGNDDDTIMTEKKIKIKWKMKLDEVLQGKVKVKLSLR